MKKIYSLIIGALLCLNVSTIVYAQNKSDNNANIIFNWAEKNYAALFPKTNSIFSSNTDSITSTSGWIYRYYAKTNNYLGVHNGSVYVAGASFPNSTSNPLKVFSIEKALVQVNADVSYADQVTLVGSELPYKVLRNDLGFEIRNGGFGSSAAAHPTKTNQFYALTDRGPNATYTGKNGKGKKFPIANYTPRIGLFQLGADAKISLIKEILLKDNNGQNITGLPNSSALGGTGETPYDVNGNVITDKAGNIKLDDFGLDAEGLAVLKDGTFWVSDEYGPHIVHFDANGKEIGRINAFTNDTRTQLNLPKEYANRRANRGMEGLTITPDQNTLVGIMQSTLYNPNKAVKNLDITRIVTINLTTHEIQQYLYKQDKPQNSNSEIVALTATEFLVIERDGSFYQGGSKPASATAQKLIYKIDLSTGTNLEKVTLSNGWTQNNELGLTLDGKTLEEVVLAHGWQFLESQGIKSVQKSKLIDMVAEVNYPHDKMEGLWIIDANTLGVLNDDDFAMWASKGVLEPKYINKEKTQIDSNNLYIIKGLNLNTKSSHN